MTRVHKLLNLTGVLFPIPSAALFIACFAFLPVATFGLKPTTSLLGLTIYTLLILFRNTVAGLDSVPPDVTEAATAISASGTERFGEGNGENVPSLRPCGATARSRANCPLSSVGRAFPW